jgi:hypothetical protein
MGADPAMKIVRVVGEARQELASASCSDDRLGVADRALRALGVKRQGEVKNLAGVDVYAGDKRGIGLVEEVLVKGYLCRIARKRHAEPVAGDGAEILAIEALVLPDARERQIDARHSWPGNNNAVGVSLKASVKGYEFERFLRRELEPPGFRSEAQRAQEKRI